MNSFHSRVSAKKAQKGITLVEVSIGLIIAAIIAAAAFAAFQNNSRRTAVRDNINVITEVAAELKNKFGRSNSYASLTTQGAVRGVVVPPDLRDVGDTAVNSYGGLIEFGPAQINTPSDAAALIWRQVPVNQCTDLILGVEGSAREIGIFAQGAAPAGAAAPNAAPIVMADAGIGDQFVKDATGAGVVLDPNDVAIQCENQAGGAETVDLVFVFGRI